MARTTFHVFNEPHVAVATVLDSVGVEPSHAMETLLQTDDETPQASLDPQHPPPQHPAWHPEQGGPWQTLISSPSKPGAPGLFPMKPALGTES